MGLIPVWITATICFEFKELAQRGKTLKILTRVEEFILIAIWNLQDDAYSLAIQRKISELSGNKWSLGTIYAPLERLERWGYILSRMSDPTPDRGGRQKRIYTITDLGKKALIRTKGVENTMWQSIPDFKIKPEE